MAILSVRIVSRTPSLTGRQRTGATAVLNAISST
jgi:hypothetical protein